MIDRRILNLEHNFRFRLEQYLAYNPDYDYRLELLCSEQAMLVVDKLRGEEQIYWFSVSAPTKKREMVPELDSNLSDEHLTHVTELALNYIRNPSSVIKVGIWPIRQADMGDENGS